MNLKSKYFAKAVIPTLALGIVGFYFIPSKSVATTASTLTGKCAAMAATPSFLLNEIDNSEAEISWVGIIDFDAKIAYSVTSEEQLRKTGSGSAGLALAKSSTPFYLHEGSASGTYSGMWSMTFNNDPNALEKIVLVPANSGNTILMLDIKMGSTGVCQKI